MSTETVRAAALAPPRTALPTSVKAIGVSVYRASLLEATERSVGLGRGLFSLTPSTPTAIYTNASLWSQLEGVAWNCSLAKHSHALKLIGVGLLVQPAKLASQDAQVGMPSKARERRFGTSLSKRNAFQNIRIQLLDVIDVLRVALQKLFGHHKHNGQFLAVSDTCLQPRRQ
jgi:hypothetical protein